MFKELCCLAVFSVAATAERPVLGTIERLDPAFDELVPKGAVMEVLAAGHDWLEGPVWDEKNERLLFSDVPRNTVYQWSEKDGVSVFLKPSGYTGTANYGQEPGSNGLAFDAEGRLLSCEHGDRRISMMTENGGKRTVADNFEGKRLNSPNDLCVHKNGSIFFTDPPYGLPERENDPTRELEIFGVYRIAVDGTVGLVDSALSRPNGVTLSPDQKTLYVTQSHGPAPIIRAYDLDENAVSSNPRTFFDTTKLEGGGLPDGVKCDEKGNVWSTGPGGVLVISPQGKLLGRLLTGQATANCAFDSDFSHLYITADAYLLRLKLK